MPDITVIAAWVAAHPTAIAVIAGVAAAVLLAVIVGQLVRDSRHADLDQDRRRQADADRLWQAAADPDDTAVLAAAPAVVSAVPRRSYQGRHWQPVDEAGARRG